jgi:gliding motility-associated-like protein
MVLKFGRCLNVTTSTLTVSTCDNYTFGNEILDASGTYSRTLVNSGGCDSIITLHLTINRKVTEQTIAICGGSSFFAGGADRTASGTYIDTLQTSLSCDSIVTTHLTVHAAPVPDLGSDRDLCAGSQSVFTPGSFATYLWQDGSTTPSFTATGVGAYHVTVQDNHQCKGSDTVQIITLLPPPAGFLPPDTSICSYGDLLIRSSGSFSTYLWSNNTVSSSITVTSPGSYWLQVKDRHDCTGKDSIIVMPKECLKGFYMPSAFTPNKDGRNDEFKPFIGGIVKQYQFTIYNRWGQLVFTTKELNKGWDGSFEGTQQDTNVFAWICTYQLEGESVKVEKGTVVLIR